MKSLFISLLASSLCVCSFAQQVRMNLSLRLIDTVVVEKFEALDNGFKVQLLHMNPGFHHIKNTAALELLSKETLVAVDLVYSDYPEGEDFSELNRKRIIELYAYLPEAFNKNVVNWRIVKQTGVKKTGGIHNYFHGFAIYYRPMPTNYAEETLIKNILAGKTKPEDSTLLKVFNRQKDWKDMLVVCDVTGSMSPYTSQLLLWIKANQKLRNMKNIVFFNDDDENSFAQVGRDDSTGIWSVSSTNFDKVIETALLAMKKGGHYENNLEAVCAAIKKFPEDKMKIVMIADNWEDPCDMKLLSFLQEKKIPIRIIVCGVNGSFNTNYLDIARKTGGSVHTMEEDLFDLASMKEGSTFKIGSIKIKLLNGQFYQVDR